MDFEVKNGDYDGGHVFFLFINFFFYVFLFHGVMIGDWTKDLRRKQNTK